MIKIQLLNIAEIDAEAVTVESLDHLVGKPHTLLWIDLVDPTPDDFAHIESEFHFHALALEDAQKRHQRPKIDIYDSYFFIVFYAVRLTEGEMLFETQEISFFIGKNYLVSVHYGGCVEIDGTVKRWQENAPKVSKAGPAILLYSILDAIVDNYFPVLDAVAERSDEVEHAVFDGDGHQALETIFLLRKNLLGLRRVLAPERDLMSTMARRDVELLGEESSVYFQDVYDHVLRVTDAIDTYRDLLSGALDVYLSVTSNNLNQVMRTLTSWSIILMTGALIAGIYGMNYRMLPYNGWNGGFIFAILLMAILGVGLFAWFKRINWL